MKGTDRALAKLNLLRFVLSVCELTMTSALYHTHSRHRRSMATPSTATMADLGQDRQKVATASQGQHFDQHSIEQPAIADLSTLSEARRKNLVNILDYQHCEDAVAKDEFGRPTNVNSVLFGMAAVAQHLKRQGHRARGWHNIIIRKGVEKRLSRAPGIQRVKEALHAFHDEMYQYLVAECMVGWHPRQKDGFVAQPPDLRAQLWKERDQSRRAFDNLKEVLERNEELAEEEMLARLDMERKYADAIKRAECAEQTIEELPPAAFIAGAVDDLAKENEQLKEAVNSSEEKLDRLLKNDKASKTRWDMFMEYFKLQDDHFKAANYQTALSETKVNLKIIGIAERLEYMTDRLGLRSFERDAQSDGSMETELASAVSDGASRRGSVGKADQGGARAFNQ